MQYYVIFFPDIDFIIVRTRYCINRAKELIEEFISEPKVCSFGLYNNDTKYVIATIGVDCNASNRIVLFISFDLNLDFNGMK